MISFLLLIVTLILLLAIEAFFAGSEIAFISANRPRIFRKAKEKNPQALLARELLEKPESLFATSVVGTTLAITSLSAVVTFFVTKKFGQDWEWLNVVFLTPIVLVIGEFIPKFVCRAFADTAVLRLSKPFRIASFILFPLTRGLELYARILRKLIGESGEKGFFVSREEIKAALPASYGTDVTASERLMVSRILEARRVKAREMLKPLIDVIAIDETETVQTALKLFNDSSHTRMPVYRERIDNIVGIIHGYDCLLAPDRTAPVSKLMRHPYFVPESKTLDELLNDLREQHMGIVVNEYGGADGLITLEDLMEEIVGEIEDEYDEPPKLYRQITENSFVVNARMEIDDLRDLLGIPIPKGEDYQTLAGFLLKHLQKIPKKWDSITVEGIEYVIQSATDRSIEEVYLIRHKPPAA